MKKITVVLLLCIFSVSLAVIFILINLQIIAFNEYFYKYEFNKYNISQKTKISDEDLSKISMDIRDYLSGKRDNLRIKVRIGGNYRYLFDSRELKHMEDVKTLFNKGFLLRDLVIITLVTSFLGILFLKKQKGIHLSLKWLLVISFALIGGFAGLLYMDFDRYFTYFHEIFFNNKFWLLNPSKEMLVNIFPEDFFYDAAKYIIISYFIELIVVTIISRGFLFDKRSRR